MAACGQPAPPAGYVFPTHKGFGGAGPAALGIGVLIEEGGCLYLQLDPPGDRQLVIWPADYQLRQDDNGGLAVVGSGNAARIGDRVQLGGGSYEDKRFVEDLLSSGSLPEPCVTPSIWMATRFVP